MMKRLRKCTTAKLRQLAEFFDPTDEELAANRELSAAWLERCRDALGLTQSQMANALGIDVATWQRAESGECDGRFSHYPRIRAMLNAVGVDSWGKQLAAKAVG